MGAKLEDGSELRARCETLPHCTLAIIEAMAAMKPALAGDPIEMYVATRLQAAEEKTVADARQVHAALRLMTQQLPAGIPRR